MCLPIICSCLLFCYVPNFTSHKTFLVNELLVLSDDCRYLVLLAKIQNKVDKNEETLLSLQRVSDFQFCVSETVCVNFFTGLLPKKNLLQCLNR